MENQKSMCFVISDKRNQTQIEEQLDKCSELTTCSHGAKLENQ